MSKALNNVIKLNDTVSVKDFGAVGDGVADDTAAIQAAIDAADDVVIPAGIYATNATITLSDNQSLLLKAGVKLLSSAATVVHVHGEYSSLIGEGNDSVIQTTVASPNGVVLLGHSSIVDSDKIQYNKIRNLRIVGADSFGSVGAFQGDYTVGLMVFNSQGWNSGGIVYYNSITDLFIQDAKEGLVLAGVVNANMFSNLYFWRIGQTAVNLFDPYSTDSWGTRYGYNWTAATLNSALSENSFANFFVDTAFAAYNTDPNYDTYTFDDGQPYETSGTCIRTVGHSVFNQFTNFLAEPTYGNAYQIATDTTHTYIQGAFNAATGTNNGTGTSLLNGSGGEFKTLNIRTANLYDVQMMEAGTAALPSLFDRFSTNTGLYFPTPGSIGITSAGVNLATWSAAGLSMNSDLRPKNSYPLADAVYSSGTNAFRWAQVYSNALYLKDGITAPSTSVGNAIIYVDSADGDLKVKFGDGTVKTIVTDT